MNKISKIWVHIRFFIKFVPIKFVGIFFSIYGAGIAILAMFLFGFNNFLLVWSLIGTFFLPIAIVLDGCKWSPLRFMMDNSRFKTNLDGLSKDYENWLDGRAINFFTNWLWHIRNRCWNFQMLFMKADGAEYLVQLIQNELTFRDHTIELSDDYGLIKADNFAGLKWITKNGREDFQTHSGVKISYDYSIFGTMELYYRVGTALYYKYSKCVLWFKAWKWIPIVGGKDIWRTIKYHPNNETGTIHFKIQWEKNIVIEQK